MTGTTIPDQPWVYSYTVAAKYSGRAILMHLGVDVSVGLGGGSGHLGRNLCTVMAGAEATTFPVGIQTSVTNTAANVLTYTFSLPDDDRLVALWTNGIAVEYDPGITATVTLPGIADHTVTGFDPLYSFEQPAITSEEDGDLVIHDLLVKDYPIILRPSPVRRVFLPVVLKGHR